MTFYSKNEFMNFRVSLTYSYFLYLKKVMNCIFTLTTPFNIETVSELLDSGGLSLLAGADLTGSSRTPRCGSHVIPQKQQLVNPHPSSECI